MNDADASKQIQQMVKFIRQEAQEKSSEISLSAEEVEVRKKMEYSMQLNASHIKVLQAQDDAVNEMKNAASKELLYVSDDKCTYKALLKGLIIQSLLRLKEPSVLLRCREMDVNLVNSVLEDAHREYANKAGVQAPSIMIDEVHLPPPPSGKPSLGPSCGVLCSCSSSSMSKWLQQNIFIYICLLQLLICCDGCHFGCERSEKYSIIFFHYFPSFFLVFSQFCA